MARLQDFQNVTPTSSDKILIVQSQGQGLANFGTVMGAKMDKANPTGTGSLSLNRKSGTTVGNYSVAEGYNGTASGDYSHAEGYGTTAGGNASHAEGHGTTASGDRTHAEGSGTTASGLYSHAENQNTTASGQDSHAEGLGTIANHAMQHVFGLYNVADTSTAAATSRGNYVEIVGNGENSANRSNARTLDWAGNEVLAGDCIIKGDISLYDATRVITPTDITFTLQTGVNLSIDSLNIRRVGKINIVNITFLTSAVFNANTEVLVGKFSNILQNYGYITGVLVIPNNTSFVGSCLVQTINGNLYINPIVQFASSTKFSTTISLLSV